MKGQVGLFATSNSASPVLSSTNLAVASYFTATRVAVLRKTCVPSFSVTSLCSPTSVAMSALGTSQRRMPATSASAAAAAAIELRRYLRGAAGIWEARSEEHTSELQSRLH